MNLHRRQPARVVSLALLVAATAAWAEDYEANIYIQSELDLYDLRSAEEISDDSLETLLELYRQGVDLNGGSREELYALPSITYAQVDAILLYRSQGAIGDPADLVGAGILTPDQLEQIAPFLIVGAGEAADGKAAPLAASARMVTAYSPTDVTVPPAYLQLRGKAPVHHLTAGLAVALTRYRIGSLQYDPVLGALTAPPTSPTVQAPKYYLRYRGDRLDAVAGIYRIGFGQRLTLDNTTRTTPDGLYTDDLMSFDGELGSGCDLSNGSDGFDPCTDEEETRRVTRDFRWTDGFRGAAVRALGIQLGGASLSVTGLGSYQSRSIYQYELYDRDTCADPRDGSSSCAAPPIYMIGDEPLSDPPRYSFQTLPELHNELLGGANVQLLVDGRFGLGVTGYAATNLWNSGELNLDFQESARYPFGGPFGAIGVDASYHAGALNFFAEATRSFDSMPDNGGGFGVLQRTTLSIDTHEWELALRYYDKRFKNPYARAIAAADEFEGARARNEAGARLRYTGKLKKVWQLRTKLDLWGLPEDQAIDTAGIMHLDAEARADLLLFRYVVPSLWLTYRNRTLDRGGFGSCYDASNERDVNGVARPCAGELYRLAAQVKVPVDRWSFTVQYIHQLVTDTTYANAFEQDVGLMAQVTWKPFDGLRLMSRTRYRFEDIYDNTRGEHSVWSWLSANYKLSKSWELAARYDFYALLDQRDSTLDRASPLENRFRFEVEAKF